MVANRTGELWALQSHLLSCSRIRVSLL